MGVTFHFSTFLTQLCFWNQGAATDLEHKNVARYDCPTLHRLQRFFRQRQGCDGATHQGTDRPFCPLVANWPFLGKPDCLSNYTVTDLPGL